LRRMIGAVMVTAGSVDSARRGGWREDDGARRRI
jgi:hypothetical protein